MFLSLSLSREEVAAGSVVADTLAALRGKIKAKFSDEIKRVSAPHKLIVQTKDVANNPHPLKNDPELVLEGVLDPDEEGNYDVYVEVVETARHLSSPKQINSTSFETFVNCAFFFSSRSLFLCA